MCEIQKTGECPSCGVDVEYTGHLPTVYLCSDCGGERPHGENVVERDGQLYYEPEGDR